jgi:hypothetical protein
VWVERNVVIQAVDKDEAADDPIEKVIEKAVERTRGLRKRGCRGYWGNFKRSDRGNGRESPMRCWSRRWSRDPKFQNRTEAVEEAEDSVIEKVVEETDEDAVDKDRDKTSTD